MNPILFNIQHFSLHDGPGIRTVLFFKGCPLDCAWCHNPESWDPVREILYTPASCIGCGACESRCPYNLPIREMLKRAAEVMGK